MTTATAALLDTLNERQLEAATSRSKRTLVVAGPGTGKTRTLVARIVWLLRERQMPSHEILALVFTRSAAAELRRRVVGEVGEDLARLLTVCTFHSLALRVLRAEPEGGLGHLRVADAEEEREAFDSLFDGPSRRRDAKRIGKTALRRELAHEAAMGASQHPSVALTTFHRRLAGKGLVTFGRIMAVAIDKSLHDDTGVTRHLRRFRHVLVDEAHDMTPGEYGLVWACDAEETLVADPRQAIFGWRGAELQWLQAHVDRYHAVELVRTYRFGGYIAAAANAAYLEPGYARIAGSLDIVDGAHEAGSDELVPTVEALAGTYGAGNVAVLCRSNHGADMIAQRLGDIAHRVRREPDEVLRTATNVARVIWNASDNAAFRAVWRACEGSEAALSAVEAAAGLYRGLASEALTGGHEVPGLARWMGHQIAAVLTFGEVLDQVGVCVQAEDLRELGIDAALNALAEREDADAFAQAGDRVQVATVHAAKGREWSAVVFVDFDTRDKQEELRVRFVAMTRAQRQLVIVTEGD